MKALFSSTRLLLCVLGYFESVRVQEEVWVRSGGVHLIFPIASPYD